MAKAKKEALMGKREISHLDLKIKFFKEWLDNGGLETLRSVELVQDIGKIKVDTEGKVIPETVSSRVNAMMSAILGSHLHPPPYHPEHTTEYRSTLSKANSFDQQNIDTTTDFDKVYDEYMQKSNILFRGQREAKWRLYNKLQRHWIGERLFESKKDYRNFIEQLVESGKTECGDQLKKILKANHIDAENSISILGYLQHHNCPTPLMDWTYSFQNALYFAVDGLIQNPGTVEIENYCSVYFIEEDHFNGGNLRLIMEDGLKEIEKPLLSKIIASIAKDEEQRLAMERHFADKSLFDRNKITGSGLINHMTKIENLMGFPIGYFSDRDLESGILFSLNNSKNILNQQGVFIWNADPSKPVEMVGDELFKESHPEEEAKGYRFCSCFNIHKSLVDHINKRLTKDGITRDFIYPTPDVSTWDIFEKCKSNDNE